MYYAPQPWLADWSALTNEIVKANEEGEDNMPTGHYQRKAKTKLCEVCGSEYTSRSPVSKYCPDCAREKKVESWAKTRAKQAENWAKRRAMQDGESTPDVPDVPADDYDTLAEKIKKTAPIETCLVQHKEDNMDTTRAERLKTFPSLSNMTEHPEYFTGDDDRVKPTVTAPYYSPADNGTTQDIPDVTAEQVDKMKEALREGLRKNKRDVLLSLYSTICDICKDVEITVPEVLDRLTRIDAALS